MRGVRNYHHGNLREELLNAAMKLLDEEGLDSLGIRQVAKKVGVAHSAPANHFKTKSELLVALSAKIVVQLVQALKASLNVDRLNSEDSIKQLSSIVLEFGLKYPNRYRLLWRSGSPLDEAMEEIYQLLTGMLQDYAERKSVDVESQAIAVWSLIHGYVTLRLDGHLQIGQDEVRKMDRQLAIIDVILEGIRG